MSEEVAVKASHEAHDVFERNCLIVTLMNGVDLNDVLIVELDYQNFHYLHNTKNVIIKLLEKSIF